MWDVLQNSIKVLRKDGLGSFLSWAAKHVVWRVLAGYWANRIHAYKPSTMQDLLRFGYTVGFGVIRPIQLQEELLELLFLLADHRPNSLLEIGTAGGGTLFLFSRIAMPDATIISIDLPGGPFGGGYSLWRVPLYKSFASCEQTIHLLRQDSHDIRTFHQVESILKGEHLDFLFIDGDHTYDGVKQDFALYSPLVRKGGIVAFHDIRPCPRDPRCQVDRFWREIKHKFKFQEIIADSGQGWGGGIGVLWI